MHAVYRMWVSSTEVEDVRPDLHAQKHPGRRTKRADTCVGGRVGSSASASTWLKTRACQTRRGGIECTSGTIDVGVG
jgi:hypothetical protein